MFKISPLKIMAKYILLALLIEFFVCNFRFFQTFSYKSTDIISEHLFKLVDKQHMDKDGIIVPFREDGWADFTAFSGDLDAKNVYLKCYYISEQGFSMPSSYVDLQIKASDEGNSLLYSLNPSGRVICSNIERSSYCSLNPAGHLKSLVLTFKKPMGQTITAVKITNLSFNKPVPISFSVVRFLIICLICVFFELFRPGSFLYSSEIPSRFKRNLTILITLFVITAALFCININKQYNSVEKYQTQYHALAEALTKGQPFLETVPSKILSEMENPYDDNLRRTMFEDTNERFYLDYAFYDGRYYVYFGILPVLLTFLPYYALTGDHLPISISVSLFGIIYFIAAFFLVRECYKRWFPKAPYAYTLTGYLLMVLASGILYAFRGPAFYGLPILTAATFSVSGLYFWISSSRSDGNPDFCKVAIGALLISLTAAARPQFLLTEFSAIPLFWDPMFTKKQKPANKIKLFLSISIPTLLIAIAVMYYNYIRFGSVMDFGANYNLTSNDMTHRGWHIDRIALGIFMYLFDPTKVTAVFPFLVDSLRPENNALHYTNYLGRTIIEGNFGGLIYNHIILLMPLFTWKLRKICKKQVFALSALFTLSAITIVVVDTQMAGLVGRYTMDFGWLLCLATTLLLGSIETNTSNLGTKYWLRTFLFISLLWGGIYEFLMFFNSGQNTNIKAFVPRLYYEVQTLLEFWL